jgi:hypothetical protein
MDLGNLVAGFGVAAVVYLAVLAVIAMLSVWLLYQIIWRAVRRGMREFYAGQLDVARSVDTIRRGPGPRDW